MPFPIKHTAIYFSFAIAKLEVYRNQANHNYLLSISDLELLFINILKMKKSIQSLSYFE